MNNQVIVYPEVQKIGDKLVDFTRPPYHRFAGLDNAVETGNYAVAPSGDVADNFTKTYKQIYPGFKENSVFTNEADRNTYHTRSEQVDYLYNKLLANGYTKMQAAAILGSAFVEGQMNENTVEKGNSEQGYGLMQ